MIRSPIKAIRAKCLDCTCGQAQEVRGCTIDTCPLHPFRFGKNPYHKNASLKTMEDGGTNKGGRDG